MDISEKILLMPSWLQSYYRNKLMTMNAMGVSLDLLFAEDIIKNISNEMYCLGNPKYEYATLSDDKIIDFYNFKIKNVIFYINNITPRLDIREYQSSDFNISLSTIKAVTTGLFCFDHSNIMKYLHSEIIYELFNNEPFTNEQISIFENIQKQLYD